MEIEKIKHDCWVYKNISGEEFRGKYINIGYTYAKFIIEKEKAIEKRLFFGLGKKVKKSKWFRVYVSNLPIGRSEFYDLEKTEKFFNEIPNFKFFIHKNRFETESEKRDRIISNILENKK